MRIASLVCKKKKNDYDQNTSMKIPKKFGQKIRSLPSLKKPYCMKYIGF